jgi:DUF971 family protein
MARPEFEPLEVAPTEDGARLAIHWADGHLSEYPPFHLRVNCPCAGCVDEYTGVRTLDARSIDPQVYPADLAYVGRYALRFDWSDGHTTGIYTWELLRGICPCPVCATAAGSGGAAS